MKSSSQVSGELSLEKKNDRPPECSADKAAQRVEQQKNLKTQLATQFHR